MLTLQAIGTVTLFLSLLAPCSAHKPKKGSCGGPVQGHGANKNSTSSALPKPIGGAAAAAYGSGGPVNLPFQSGNVPKILASSRIASLPAYESEILSMTTIVSASAPSGSASSALVSAINSTSVLASGLTMATFSISVSSGEAASTLPVGGLPQYSLPAGIQPVAKGAALEAGAESKPPGSVSELSSESTATTTLTSTVVGVQTGVVTGQPAPSAAMEKRAARFNHKSLDI